MAVRRLPHGMGCHGLHRGDLSVRPGLVFASGREVLFVHGCFRHSHQCRKGRLPASGVDYWSEKIDRNTARDVRSAGLEARRSDVCVVWESETADPHSLQRRLVRFLDGNPL